MNIFEYQNYRLYLKDFYEEQKSIHKGFSYRSFSAKAGINASAFLYYIIQGKRNLTQSSILKISQAIGHSKEESEYFENLVYFNQAQTITEKTLYYNNVLSVRKPLEINKIGKEQYEYYATWFNSVIRELITFYPFSGNYAKLAEFISPPITPKQAQQSVELLEKLGFIERDTDGLYHQTSSIIAVHPKPIDSYIITKFQQEMLKKALESYDRFDVHNVLGASTTFSISKATFELMKSRIREFRRELAALANIDTAPDQVFQLTVNFFPVSGSHKNA